MKHVFHVGRISDNREFGYCVDYDERASGNGQTNYPVWTLMRTMYKDVVLGAVPAGGYDLYFWSADRKIRHDEGTPEFDQIAEKYGVPIQELSTRRLQKSEP